MHGVRGESHDVHGDELVHTHDALELVELNRASASDEALVGCEPAQFTITRREPIVAASRMAWPVPSGIDESHTPLP